MSAMKGCKQTPEHRANISKAQKERMGRPGERAKLSNAMKGNTNGRGRLGFRGPALSPEHRAKIGAGLMGHAVSSETREKLSVANMGNTHNVGKHYNAVPVGSTHIRGGYRMVKVADPDVWEREHRVVMGVPLNDPRVVHHEDEDKLNNAPANLMIYGTGGEHTQHHNEQRRLVVQE